MKLENKLDKITLVKGECRDLALRIEQDYRLNRFNPQDIFQQWLKGNNFENVK